MTTTSNQSGCPYLNMMAKLKGTASSKKLPSPVNLNNLPPGPKGLPIIGSSIDFMKDPLGFLQRNVQKYGDIFSFWRNGVLYVHLNRPDLVHQLLVTDYEKSEKSHAGTFKEARRIMGDGLLLSPNQKHNKDRRLIQPAFSSSNLKKYGHKMPALTSQYLSYLKKDQTFNLTATLDRLTLYILIQTLFGRHHGQSLSHTNTVVEKMHQYLSPKYIFYSHIWPSFLRNPFHKKLRAFRLYLKNEIDQLLVAPSNSKDDLISQMADHLLTGKTPDKENFIDHVITLLLAGHETTATTLNWAYTLLSQHPDWERLFHQEIDSVFGGKEPTPDKIDQLNMTDMILKETMRLYPAIWAQSRQLLSDAQFDHYVIPRGTVVGTSQYILHRDPRFYRQADQFNPLRWTKEMESKRPEFSYFPFGGGPRSCIGGGFAMMEMKLVMATIAQQWHFKLWPGQKIDTKPLVTLRPKYAIFMQAITRNKERIKDTVV